MQMTFRWFGSEKDTVSLEQIRQIPNVVGVVPALHYLPAGEAWSEEDIFKMKKEIEDAGLTMECIESVNVQVHFSVLVRLWFDRCLVEHYCLLHLQ